MFRPFIYEHVALYDWIRLSKKATKKQKVKKRNKSSIIIEDDTELNINTTSFNKEVNLINEYNDKSDISSLLNFIEEDEVDIYTKDYSIWHPGVHLSSHTPPYLI